MARSFAKWMLPVNEANERFSKMKWSGSLSEWKNEWIRLIMKTRKKNERKKRTNAFANEGWMTNDKQWIRSLLNYNYDKTVFWMVG